MANMRIIYDNKADSATIIASNTEATNKLIASNMQNEYKGKVHRSASTTVYYDLTWTQAQNISGIGLPATNLSPSSTIRVRLYTLSGDTTPVADSGIISATGISATSLYNWANPLNVNSFAYGGATKTAVWFSQAYSVRWVRIDIVDTSNTAGYIDCSRIVCGTYWEPKYNVSNGISYTLGDTSQISRNDSGDLLSDRGFIYDQLNFDLSYIIESDKSKLLQLFKNAGTSKNIFISLFPESNSSRESDHIIYGKRSVTDISTPYYGIYTHSMSIEGW